MAKALKPLRWTIEQAARECSIDRKTLTKRIMAEGITPGDDGMFATSDILKAIVGDLDREKTRDTAAAADLREMKRDEMRKRLIPREAVRAALEELKVVITQVIEHTDLSLNSKREIFAALRKLNEHDFTAGAEAGADE